MKLGFIGGGNMAAALIGGLRRADQNVEILVVEREAARRAVLERDFGVSTRETVDVSLQGSAILLLAVKPSDLRPVCEALARLPDKQLVLSIAAGIPSAAIARWCGTEAVVRAMPNTPALIGQGITGLYARGAVDAQQRAAAARALQAIGQVEWFDDEAMLDVVTAVSGSGPAYVFYFIEALQDAARRMGMDARQARQFTVQTFVGAAQLAAQSGDDVGLLRERVTSKGGTTAAALARLQDANVGPAIVAAAFAALERAREMARTLAP
ncbi:MAG TPA: pyrroline-5-carboxylate reductase [Burkholderiaceae bacterium]|nr:pyrroline-5-carboxylate reductase [Burkholderiaceae bacterium]